MRAAFARASLTGMTADDGDKVDRVALQQRDLVDNPVFHHVMSNNTPELMKYLERNYAHLELRDSVGATPLLIAFLYMNFDLGKQVIRTYPGPSILVVVSHSSHAASKGFPYALASYASLDPANPSPYQGENILHIAIVHRKVEIVKWLVETLPDLLDAETTGEFFSPSKACYFGGSPLLFAVSSRQFEAAKYILQAADKANPGSAAARTSIFMMDSHGNNALHLAVVHDLPEAYDFAMRHAMARFPNACPPNFDPDNEDEPYNLPLFIKKLQGNEKDHFEKFIRKHNTDFLTPLTLAAAMGKANMFKHILMSLSIKSWEYGPVTSRMLPLRGLEERQRRPRAKKVKSNATSVVRPTTAEVPSVETSGRTLHKPSAWQRLFDRRRVKTAVEILGSNSLLSKCIPERSLEGVLHDRLALIDSFEVKSVLDKKWQFSGRRLFMFNFRRHVLFCVVFTCSTFFTHHYRDDGVNIDWSTAWAHVVLEAIVVLEMLYRVYYESKQMFKNGILGYIEDTGAAMVDNILKLSFCILIILAIIFRAAGSNANEDACVSLALLCTYLYFFFFLLGFRSTGPFVVMIMRMLVIDVGRFVVIYTFVLAGFSIALYVIVDQRSGAMAWLTRMKNLALASFCSTFAWADYQQIDVMALSELSQVLVFMYLFIVAIVFINLLIATMGNTYEAIQEASEQQWYAERANIMSSMEVPLSKAQKQANRKRYAVELEGERFLQVEYVDADAWLGVHENDLARSFKEFKRAVTDYRQRKADDDDDEGPVKQNIIDARMHELYEVLF
ncbi:Aste57867_17755 [Aphanomyces stellatus]|uniref:Aste57867_17755 protein n=1 Tax=Aphanomyces stellatus TaxID=120398 RepID=A0A485L994_9STRA|nr:hypothetical protein As57867_017694 [Aphanomyces stellatus]VFT94501.1 Aste57867_17755 [Aphanomyces stellatus]